MAFEDMKVDIKKGKPYLIKKDLQDYSVWVMHQSDDLFYPVLGADDLSEEMKLTDLSVRAVFKAPNGLQFDGYIVGIKDVYCIAIFLKDKVFYLNKNLYNDCLQTINKINNLLSANFNVNSYFPLEYETNIDISEFKNSSGEFDIFKKRTEEERLG